MQSPGHMIGMTMIEGDNLAVETMIEAIRANAKATTGKAPALESGLPRSVRPGTLMTNRTGFPMNSSS